MKIKSAEITNFKGIKNKVINVDGRSFVISGPNGAGKSSEIQAMFGVLSGKGLPKTIMPIDSSPGDIARVEVVVGDNGGNDYHLIATYSEHPKTGAVEGKVTVKDSDNKTVKISVFRNLIGDVSFDIYSGFLQKSKQDQVSFVKELTGRKMELDKLDIERERLYDERTAIKKERQMLELELKDKSIDSEVFKIPTEPIVEKMKTIEEKQDKWLGVMNGLASRKEALDNLNDSIEGHKFEIEKLVEQIKAHERMIAEKHVAIEKARQDIEKGEGWLARNPKPSYEGLQSELMEANENNKRFEEQESLKSKFADLVKTKERIETIEKGMKVIDTQKAKIISESSLPVPGMTFDEDGLYVNGVPFAEINTAKQWEVGTRFMIAMNNRLRVCKLDMNVMDKNTFVEIVRLAEEHGMQLILELVNWSADTNETEVKFVEEYL